MKRFLVVAVFLAWVTPVWAATYTLTWTDTATGEISWRVERRTMPSGAYGEVGYSLPDTPTFTDDTVPDTGSYRYRIRPQYLTTYGGYSNEACIPTACTPSAPTNVTATGVPVPAQMSLVATVYSPSTYDLPNIDSDCPGNCRQIPWRAGSDQWNSGNGLPTYTGVTCSGLTEGNQTSTNNYTAIQNCLNNTITNGQAAVIPPGIYYVSGTITIPSNRALRGSGTTNCTQGTWLSSTFAGDTGVGAACTTIRFGSGSGIQIGSSNPTFGSEINMDTSVPSGFTKGSTQITLTGVSGLAVGDWLSIFEDSDPTLLPGGNGGCTWCGNNTGSNMIQQFAQITNIAGNVVTISRPLYYTYLTTQDPAVMETTWQRQYAGIEDLKLNGNYTDFGAAFIYIRGALFSWVKNVETYLAPSCAKCAHVTLQYSHGVEVRDSYFHSGRACQGDRNYGVFTFMWNSDGKIENNIMRAHRHSTVAEGGGSGMAYLYNYIDDNWECQDASAPQYLGSARTNHGPMSLMNLWEGNVISHLEADDVFSGVSHNVIFRNHLRGAESDLADRDSAATHGFYGIDWRAPTRYFSAVGNVLGMPSWTSGAGYTVMGNSSTACGDILWQDGEHAAYLFGCDGTFSSLARSTAILHGNYDYVSDSVSVWDGGANHTLRDSMYYAGKPSWFGACTWPPISPTGPTTATLPAQHRFAGTSCP